MRGNPIETVRLKRVASTDGGLSVPSCGAIPSKRLLSGTMKCTTWSFSPLMRGNPIETCTAGMCGVVASCNFQSPHAGQSHRNMMKSMCQCQNCQIFQSPHAGQSHRNFYSMDTDPANTDLSVPSCGAIPSKLRSISGSTLLQSNFQSPHAGQSHRNSAAYKRK